MAQRPDAAPAPATPLPALPAEALRWRCDPAALPWASSAEIEPQPGVIGQDTAMDALRFGLAIHAPGQNIFVRGLTGTGRMTLVRRLLGETQLQCPAARDRCYVHNFVTPDRPRLITLPRGHAARFKRRVDTLVDFIRDDLHGALTTANLRARQLALEQESNRAMEELIRPLEQELKEGGLGLLTAQAGAVIQAVIVPLIDGRAVPPDQWDALRAEGQFSDEQFKAYEAAQEKAQSRLQEVMRAVTTLRRGHADRVRQMREDETRTLLGALTHDIERDYAVPSVTQFLTELVDDVVATRLAGSSDDDDTADLAHYRVNVLVTHGRSTGCPIVVENTPTLGNLLGAIERRVESNGATRSDHTMIRPGALLRSDGGFLILDARDVLTEPGAWKALVRTLRTGLLEIVPPEMAMPWWTPTLKPEAIDLNVKVILLGDAEIYYTLDAYDPDFPHLFKVLADFDSTIAREPDGLAAYGGVLARIIQDEHLPTFDRTAIAAIAEHGARIASSQDRLTTRFGRLADIAREAVFLAGGAGATVVDATHVTTAVRNSKRRVDLPSRRFRAHLANGTIRVATHGTAVGQINGLAVSQAGPLTSGFPVRITASIGAGASGVINIEREAQLSGAIHTKGFYILGGLLRTLLRTVHPLAFHASIAFEQSYGGIDGDSASGAEICCLLSALTELPVRQDLAMTGAIDQVGNILAIGAVNEKIEGFYDTCADLGLTGTQGVLIPQANTRDLMLRSDVVDACRAGRFHVYGVDRVHDALGLLTGVDTGTPGEDGEYPANTVLGIAVERAFEYWVRVSQSPSFQEVDEPAAEAGGDAV